MQIVAIRRRSIGWCFGLLFGFSTLWVIQSCKKEPEVDPGFGPNGEPRVLAVHIPDIPDQNIQINQDTKQIAVTVPTSYSASSIRPALTLTPGTTAINSSDYSLDVFGDVGNNPLVIRTSDNKTNTYAMVLKPAGDLAFGTYSGPQSYTLSDRTAYLCLPVYNYIDGTGYQNNSVMLVNKATGERVKPSVVVYGRESICDRKIATDGAVIVSIYLNSYEIYYQPGDYSVEITRPSGRKATLTQTIQLIKGPTIARFDAAFPLTLNSGDYLLYGSNYYKTDKLSVLVRGRNQPSTTVDALGFIDKQPGIRLPTALNLKPGYYYAQLLINGVASPSSGRITISNQASPLIIGSLSLPGQTTFTNLLGETYAFDTPVTMTKGVTYATSTNGYVFMQSDAKSTARFQLALLPDKTTVYSVPVSLDNGSERFTIPTTVPAGRYELHPQVVRGDGSLIDGIPLERDVQVQ